MIIISRSEKETFRLGAAFAQALQMPAAVGLYGELGAGKSVFVRGVASFLGITEPIVSPTFTLVQEYPFSAGRLFHLDLYRIDNEEDAFNFGIEDYFMQADSLTFVEWAERLPSLLPEKTFKITFQHIEENYREITLPKGMDLNYDRSCS